ncbi:unnamed protein product [Moneuplotes crassus]|uniref:Uncharacterized protein n=1 Tax=Euplotes crassus TaxID=5936 RepID=A0AAD1XE99_EUPCR|nr:unnamed protein product [Moneuplotes crassus]
MHKEIDRIESRIKYLHFSEDREPDTRQEQQSPKVRIKSVQWDWKMFETIRKEVDREKMEQSKSQESEETFTEFEQEAENGSQTELSVYDSSSSILLNSLSYTIDSADAPPPVLDSKPRHYHCRISESSKYITQEMNTCQMTSTHHNQKTKSSKKTWKTGREKTVIKVDNNNFPKIRKIIKDSPQEHEGNWKIILSKLNPILLIHQKYFKDHQSLSCSLGKSYKKFIYNKVMMICRRLHFQNFKPDKPNINKTVLYRKIKNHFISKVDTLIVNNQQLSLKTINEIAQEINEGQCDPSLTQEIQKLDDIHNIPPPTPLDHPSPHHQTLSSTRANGVSTTQPRTVYPKIPSPSSGTLVRNS